MQHMFSFWHCLTAARWFGFVGMQLWDGLMATVLVYTLLVLPFRICFLPPGFATPRELGFWTEAIVNIVFSMDMIVNCITGIYVPKVCPAGRILGGGRGAFSHLLLQRLQAPHWRHGGPFAQIRPVRPRGPSRAAPR